MSHNEEGLVPRHSYLTLLNLFVHWNGKCIAWLFTPLGTATPTMIIVIKFLLKSTTLHLFSAIHFIKCFLPHNISLVLRYYRLYLITPWPKLSDTSLLVISCQNIIPDSQIPLAPPVTLLDSKTICEDIKYASWLCLVENMFYFSAIRY